MQRSDRKSVKCELWLVQVSSPFPNDGLLYAWFFAYDANCSPEKVKKRIKERALERCVFEEERHWSPDDINVICISSPAGTFSPETFRISMQDISNNDGIYCESLELRLQNPHQFDINDTLELKIVIGDDIDGASCKVCWPCINRTTIIAQGPGSVGIQQNYFPDVTELMTPPVFRDVDTTDAITPSKGSSTPCVKNWSSPVSSDTSSSSYHTPPASPLKEFGKTAISPISKAQISPDDVDSGFSSRFSSLSLRSVTPQSRVRSYRGSESGCSVVTPTSEQTPRKARCQSVPSTPRGKSSLPHSHSASGFIRRKLCEDFKKDKRPPWKP